MARLIHHFYRDQKMVGWELDGEIIDLARKYMGLAALEEQGCLVRFHL